MKKLKDTIYELEGLVELAEMRPEKTADLRPLMQARIDALLAEWKKLNAVESPRPAVVESPRPADAVADSPSPECNAGHTASRIALCLNDRFRFMRLLGGDRARFDTVMAELSSKPDFETARDYLIDICNLDPSDPDVADLVEILQQYYS